MKFISNAIRCLAFFVTIIGSANAAMPESGWWWNASESGRGYAIEIQDNKLFLSSFTYDSNGIPVWYYSSGTLTGDSNYSGRLLSASNGACFGCTQRAPNNTDVGSIGITFKSASTATVSLLGFTTAITRFDFTGGDNVSKPNACFGEWSGVIDSSSFPIYYGERMKFNTQFDNSTLSGSRLGDSTGTALCRYDPSVGWIILLDSSTNYWRAFSFDFVGFNRMEGTSWIYPKGGALSGSGSNWVAFRTGSKNSVQGGSGPKTAKSQIRYDPSMDAKRQLQDKSDFAAVIGGGPVKPGILDMTVKLELAFPK